MTRGWLAPLSPPEEIGLRKVAHGSPVIDAQVAASLCRLALIERIPSGLRLTPLGRQRYDAMPKALLQAHRHSLHAVAGYVEGLLEKAQVRARLHQNERRVAPPPPAVVVPEEPEEFGEGAFDDEPTVIDHSQLKQWKMQADVALDKVRRALEVHRARDAKLSAASLACIEASRLLLRETVPAGSPGLDAIV